MTVDIDKLEQLARAATLGPWEPRHLGYGHSHEVVRLPSGAPDDGGDIVATMWENENEVLRQALRALAEQHKDDVGPLGDVAREALTMMGEVTKS